MNAEINLKVRGMHCKSCESLIKMQLGRLKGVESVEASFPEEKVMVVFDSGLISEEVLKEELANLGYPLAGTSGKPEHDNSNSKPNENKSEVKTTLMQGIIYGLVPHIGCIGFVVASILGVTVAANLFRPLLLNPLFFYGLIALSLGFATISSVYYLKRNGILSLQGVKRKKKYLGIMYGTTIAVSLLFLFVVFPFTANLNANSFSSPTGNLVLANVLANNGSTINSSQTRDTQKLATLSLQVEIPCSGHASLISGDIKSIEGVVDVKFRPAKYFDVSFDAEKTSKEKILALEIFKTYKATVVSESSANLADKTAGASASTGSSCSMPAGSCGCGAK